jgi:hypothetical protein
MFGELLDEAVKLSTEKKNQIHFITCDGVNRICMFNKYGSKPICLLCKEITKKALLRCGINYIPLKKYTNKSTSISWVYINSDDLRKIKYREVNIGLSIMSSFISLTRNMYPKIDKRTRKYFNQHLSQNKVFVDSLYKIIEIIKPDIIYSFNGRYEETRPIYDICQHLKIKCVLMEVFKKNDKWYKVMFENSLPHNIKENIKRREYCWEKYNLSNEEKIQLGKSFYEKRRYGEYSGDKKIYVSNQKEGYTPEFNKDKTNIAIMNSSEDEYAAVGSEWDSLKLFNTQYEGIIYLLENSVNSIHYFLRIHPNLSSIKYKYHILLNELESKYSNITVITADSNMSTYSLMEKVDKIISFGSTMGLECVFWGKPSILIGPARFYYDNISYVPKSKTQLLEMITRDLSIDSNNINIYKNGAYIMNQDPLIIDLETQFKFVNFDLIRCRFLGKEYSVTHYQNFFINMHITGLLIAVLRVVFDNRLFGVFKIPLQEE